MIVWFGRRGETREAEFVEAATAAAEKKTDVHQNGKYGTV